jgi:hypothetical protein
MKRVIDAESVELHAALIAWPPFRRAPVDPAELRAGTPVGPGAAG